jgi:hypothetical protein
MQESTGVLVGQEATDDFLGSTEQKKEKKHAYVGRRVKTTGKLHRIAVLWVSSRKCRSIMRTCKPGENRKKKKRNAKERFRNTLTMSRPSMQIHAEDSDEVPRHIYLKKLSAQA